MGERKGTNKYYPPDFDPKKHRSLAGYHGQHPLRERARKLHQGILVIRFEMPYNIWCEGCNKHIGMGVRYNAEKSKIGNYYTTPIYKFRMKCHLCDNYMEIKTDPANHDYVIISGARRKEQRWDPKENEQIVPEDRASQKKLATDAMYRLEHGVGDKAKLKAATPGVAQIAHHQQQWKDDYMLNKLARTKFRAEKRSLQHTADSDSTLLSKSSLDLALVPEHKDDIHMAELLQYRTVESFDEKQQQKRNAIESRPLFGGPSSSLASPPSNQKSSAQGALLLNVANAKHKLRLAKSAASFGNLGISPRQAQSSLGIICKSQKEAVNKDISAKTCIEQDILSSSVQKNVDMNCDQLGNCPQKLQDIKTQPQSLPNVSSDSPPDIQENLDAPSNVVKNSALGALVLDYSASDSDST